MSQNSHAPKQLFFYSLLAFPLAFVGLPLYMHAPEFYASEWQISLVTLGSLLLILRLIDALQDPLIGSLSDHLSRYRIWIIWSGAVLLMGGFWLLFHPLPNQLLISFGLGIFLSTTGFSLLSINLQTLGGLWQSTPAERTRITTWREGIGLVGLVTAAALPTWLSQQLSPAGGFHLFSLIFIPILLIGVLSFLYWLKTAPLTAPQHSYASLGWKHLNSPWYRHFLGIYLLSSIAAAIPGVLILFFIKDHLQAEQWIGGFLLLYFMSGALGMPIWQQLAKRFGKLRSWLWNMGFSMIIFIWAFSLGAGDITAFAIICMLSGLALGGDLALPPAILADQLDSQHTQPLAARAFSMLTFLSKSSLAFATGISLPILGWLGYQPGTVGAQTEALSTLYALVPTLIKGFAFVWLVYFLKSRLANQT